MSLIIDALRKAQQLRLRGSAGPLILKYPPPNKKKGIRFKKEWVFISAVLPSLFILFILLRPTFPPSASHDNRAMVVAEWKSSELAAEKMSQETSKKDEEPLPTLNREGSGQSKLEEPPSIGVAFSGRALQSEGEKKSLEIEPTLKEKKVESMIEEAPRSFPLTTQKEEAPSKSIGVGQEGGNDSTRTSDVLTHFNSGVHFYNQKEFSKAVLAYQKVIELDPTYVEAYNNLGIIYQLMGNVEKAFWAYQKSTEINPKYEKGYNNLGILLLLKGRYDEALAAFEKALAINSNNIESHLNLGTLFKKEGEWEKAIESYHKALAIDPLHRETHYNIALLYEQLEKLDLAISHYQQFIRLSSKSHPELVARVQRHLNTLAETKGSKNRNLLSPP